MRPFSLRSVYGEPSKASSQGEGAEIRLPTKYGRGDEAHWCSGTQAVLTSCLWDGIRPARLCFEAESARHPENLSVTATDEGGFAYRE